MCEAVQTDCERHANLIAPSHLIAPSTLFGPGVNPRPAMLHDFLDANRIALVDRCRDRAAARRAPHPSPGGVEHAIPAFLAQVIETLRLEDPLDWKNARTATVFGPDAFRLESDIGATAAKHGHEMLLQGFAIDDIVHGYGDLAQAVVELAIEKAQPIAPEAFGILVRCADRAIAGAASEFCRRRDRLIAATDGRAMGERLGLVTEELCGLVNTALLSFVAIKEGGVGLRGATSGVLERSLVSLNELIALALMEGRLATGEPAHLDRIAAERFIAEARVAASLEATSKGCELTVVPVERGLAFQADRHLLLSAVAGLLHNALEQSHPRGQVWLRAHATVERVLIEVEDQGGGIPEGGVAPELRAPAGGSSRDAASRGLHASCRAVEAMGGSLGIRDMPGVGCVFTIDLPRRANEVASNTSPRAGSPGASD
jgi:signal transduction histidine kinase